MNWNIILCGLLNVALVLVIAPFFISLIKKVKALCQGRKGPGVFQSYFNLVKLLRKEVVYSDRSSFIMVVSPYINLVFLLAACLAVPLVYIPTPSNPVGNIILFVYLLAVARFFMALSGLDSASTFGGMGSSREMSLSSVFEPVIILVFASVALVLKTTNIHDMFFIASSASSFSNPLLLLSCLSLFIVLIVETSRVPVDNPETHLELTMVHEAMILEHSGRNLAMMELSYAIKQTILMALLINILFPYGVTTSLTFAGFALGAVLFLVKAAVLAVVIGIFESYHAKLRLFRVPSLVAIAFFFSLLTILIGVFA